MSRLCRLKCKSHGEDGKWAYNEIIRLRKELDESRAASQAREAKLREALVLSNKALEAIASEMTVGDRYTNAGEYLIDSLIPSREALSQPTDDTALRDMITKAGEVMRQRNVDKAFLNGFDINDVIWALPGVTLDDVAGSTP